MAGYSREMLVDAFLSRYWALGSDVVTRQKVLAEQLYDKVGKDKFRVYASLDSEAIKVYKALKK